MRSRRRKWSIDRLERRKTTLLRKLANSKDPDDPAWVQRFVACLERGIARKERAREQKLREKRERRSV